MELPEYLIMKIAVRDENGHVHIYRKFPGAGTMRSRLSHAIPAVRDFHSAADNGWPGGPLPLTLEFSAENPTTITPSETSWIPTACPTGISRSGSANAWIVTSSRTVIH